MKDHLIKWNEDRMRSEAKSASGGKNKRILIAMSGGVDSSVAAYLLKQQGYDVIGITMHLWSGDDRDNVCCSLSSVEDARKVANKIRIPHYTLNMERIFEEKVVRNFIEEYKVGRTPNPCVRCNQYIKFDALLSKAEKLGAEYVSTGHYARVEKWNGRYLLLKGLDSKKDQSYFLYPMKQKALSRTLFPMGNITKAETRKIAGDLGLPVAEKQESQEICFVPDENYGKFLKNYISDKVRPGSILDKEGNVIGEHDGIIFYTIGQRKGLGIGGDGPYYVISIDKAKNAIVVGGEQDIFSSELIAEKVNFVSIEKLSEPMEVRAKIRYNAAEEDAVLEPYGRGIIRLRFSKPVRAVTPGQSVVFYQGDKMVGGGIIMSPNDSI